MKRSLAIILGLAATAGAIAFSCGENEKKHDGADVSLPASEPIAAVAGDAIFVVNGADATLTVIDAVTLDVKGTIALRNASYPHHIYLKADRSVMALAIPGMDLSGGHGGATSPTPSGGHPAGHSLQADMARSAVLVLDAATGATKVARFLDTMNHNAVFSPDGTEIWTAQMAETGAVLVLDAASLATKQSIAVGAMPAEITFTRDGSKAFVGNSGANSVSVIDVSTKAVVTTIPVGAAPVGAWVGLDDVMYVDNEAGKSLTAIDAKTLAVVRTYELGFTPAMAATAPSGELWVTDTDAGRIVVFAAGTTTKAGEIETGAGAHAIAFSADGQTAYSTSQTSGTVSVIDVATRAVKKTITVGAKPNGIAFRPAL